MHLGDRAAMHLGYRAIEDALVCSRCGSEMKIFAYIHDPKEIKTLTTHLGITQYCAPPPLKTGSSERYVLSDDEH